MPIPVIIRSIDFVYLVSKVSEKSGISTPLLYLATTNILTVLLEYIDLFPAIISYNNSRIPLTLGIVVTFLVVPCRYKLLILCLLCLKYAHCSKLAYYAGFMLNALACLLCLKLCWCNWRRPSYHHHKLSL